MKVLLNKDIKKLGFRGDIVDVKPGYFRNFLFPQGAAIIATEKIIELANERNKDKIQKRAGIIKNAKEILGKLKGLTIKLTEKVSSKNKLYASVTEQEVVEAIKNESGIEVTKDLLKMDHIKTTGEHTILVHLGQNLEEKITVLVEKAA